MFYPNALFAVHKLTFLPARLVERENLPSPEAFSSYEKMGGGGGEVDRSEQTLEQVLSFKHAEWVPFRRHSFRKFYSIMRFYRQTSFLVLILKLLRALKLVSRSYQIVILGH
jgi:hypothetical protein